jgi:hypothetical protein
VKEGASEARECKANKETKIKETREGMKEEEEEEEELRQLSHKRRRRRLLSNHPLVHITRAERMRETGNAETAGQVGKVDPKP